MATESDLRDLLQGPDPEGRGAIDLEAVLTRARRRRRPRVIAAQALGSVALVGGLGFAVVSSLPATTGGVMTIAEDRAGGEDFATAPRGDDLVRWMPDACGAPATEVAPSGDLGLEIAVGTTEDPDGRIPVVVTLRNDGPDRVTGVTGSAPHLTFSLDGTVVWHSYSTQDYSVRLVDLEPGASIDYLTFAERAVCGSEDDLVTDDPGTSLPPAPPGDYELRALILLSPDDGAAGPVVVTGPAAPVVLR